jgi:hypothetical protein
MSYNLDDDHICKKEHLQTEVTVEEEESLSVS